MWSSSNENGIGTSTAFSTLATSVVSRVARERGSGSPKEAASDNAVLAVTSSTY
jgi:hypothetical protein